MAKLFRTTVDCRPSVAETRRDVNGVIFLSRTLASSRRFCT
jgi:hypothetical protein